MAQTESKKVWIIITDFGPGGEIIRSITDTPQDTCAIVKACIELGFAFSLRIREVELNHIIEL